MVPRPVSNMGIMGLAIHTVLGTEVTQTLYQAKLTQPSRSPCRYLKRIIHATLPCRYRREEYATAGERNERYRELRSLRGIVKYSDYNGTGICVWVVAWPIDRDGAGMTPANKKATGGRVPFGPERNSPEIDPQSGSMEHSGAGGGKLENSEVETSLMEHKVSSC